MILNVDIIIYCNKLYDKLRGNSYLRKIPHKRKLAGSNFWSEDKQITACYPKMIVMIDVWSL